MTRSPLFSWSISNLERPMFLVVELVSRYTIPGPRLTSPEIVSSTRRLKVRPLTNLKYAQPAVPTIATVAAVFWTMSAQAWSVER